MFFETSSACKVSVQAVHGLLYSSVTTLSNYIHQKLFPSLQLMFWGYDVDPTDEIWLQNGRIIKIGGFFL